MNEIEKLETRLKQMKTALSKAQRLQEYSQDYGYYLAKQDYQTASQLKEHINELVLEMRFAGLGLEISR